MGSGADKRLIEAIKEGDEKGARAALAGAMGRMIRAFGGEGARSGGADPSARDPMGSSALRLAIGAKMEGLAWDLVEAGASLSGEELAAAAAKEGMEEILGKMLSRGANPNERDQFGQAAAHAAAEKGRAGALRRLISAGASLEERDAEGRSALLVALEKGREEAALALIEGGADPKAASGGMSALGRAARQGMERAVKALIGRGAPLEEGAGEETPLELALSAAREEQERRSWGRGRAFFFMSEEERREPSWEAAARDLLAAGAKATPSAVALAAQAGYGDLLAEMLEGGADPNGIGASGLTPLGAAKAELCALLAERGARLEEKDQDGWTALQRALCRGDFAKARELARLGASARERGPLGRGAAWLAAEAETLGGRESALASALELGGDPNEEDEEGNRPLHAAAMALERALAKLSGSGSGKGKDGEEARAAAIRRAEGVISALVAAGADPSARNRLGQTAADLVVGGGPQIKGMLASLASSARERGGESELEALREENRKLEREMAKLREDVSEIKDLLRAAMGLGASGQESRSEPEAPAPGQIDLASRVRGRRGEAEPSGGWPAAKP